MADRAVGEKRVMSEEIPEPELDSAVVRGIQKGVAEFNAGKFFECHDTLEEIWQGIRGPARDFFQGLIQISVGFYHLRNGNLRGGERPLGKGLRALRRRLRGYGTGESARGTGARARKSPRRRGPASECSRFTQIPLHAACPGLIPCVFILRVFGSWWYLFKVGSGARRFA